MKVLSREKELATLSRLYQSEEAEFLALYGRRRVGKTYLVKQFFQDKEDVIFFSATGSRDGDLAEQADNFLQRIAEVFYGGVKLEKMHNWNKLFNLLTDTIKKQEENKKVVIFLDELPWMATTHSRLLQQLDYYWNQYWSFDSRILLIVCGSSASWIIEKILNNTGGLHNRVTETMHLEAFDLSNTKKYLDAKHINLSNEQVLLIYLVTGGVPYYLSKIRWKLSAIQIIEKLAFNKGSFFLEEFDNLFSSLFKNHEIYVEILRKLSKKPYGCGKIELLKSAGSVGGSGLKRLDQLEEAGFIKSFNPLFHKKRGTYYRLIDEYTNFYFKWIEPIKILLQSKGLDGSDWQAIQSTQKWKSWLGYAFETVCYKHLPQIKKALSLPPLSMPDTWRYVPKKFSPEEGAQIDLLFDRQDDAITICEIKYTSEPFVITKEYLVTINKKMSVFKEQTRSKKQLLLSFISAKGLKHNDYAKQSVSSVAVLDDLFIDVD